MSEATPTPAPTPTPTPEASSTGQTPAGSNPTPAQGGLEFIPENYRQESWASKYTTPDDFFKGVSNMAKMVGQKQVVQGIQVPGPEASDDDWNNYYKSTGRPEAADKYNYGDDLKAFDGFDLAAEKTAFSDLAFKHGLSEKQAAGLFKDYISNVNSTYEKNQAAIPSLDQAKKEAFGDNVDEGYGLANKASEALGITDKLNEKGLGRDPLVLRILAEAGKGMGEDGYIPRDGGGSKEGLLAQAKELQMSDAYKSGDKEVHKQVQEIYKQVYPS